MLKPCGRQWKQIEWMNTECLDDLHMVHVGSEFLHSLSCGLLYVGLHSLAVAAITKLLWWWWFYFIYQLWIWHRRFSCYRLFSNRVRNLADVLTGCSGLLQGEVSNLRATLQTRLQTDDFRKVSLLSAAAAEKTHAKSFGSSYFCMYALQPYVRD